MATMTGERKFYGCHNCDKGAGEWCFTCRRVGSEDLALRKKTSGERVLSTVTAKRSEKQQPLTNLDADAEETLLSFLYQLTALDPVNALMLLHFAKGGRIITFQQFALNVAEKIIKHFSRDGKSKRQKIHARYKALCASYPAFLAIGHWMQERRK